MKKARRRIDVNLNELDQVLDEARQAPLSETDCEKLKSALHALAAMLEPSRNTEKTSAVVGKPEGSETGSGTQPDSNTSLPGHGRNGAEAFSGAHKVEIAHQKLAHGDRCPECGKGNVYQQKEPKVLVRIVGQAPLAATVYSLERLRSHPSDEDLSPGTPAAALAVRSSRRKSLKEWGRRSTMRRRRR